MCIIAAYIGPQRAAPILIEMMRRGEGIDAGFYTGLATIDQGKLHYEKVVGDVATLLDQTAAADLPGTIGIIHSRTNSGGGREWGHPFIDTAGELAYVANGAVGQFENREGLARLTETLQAKGHRFNSAVDGAVGNYPRLSNGQAVHISDILCQAIADAYARLRGDHSQPLLAAAMEVYQDYPGEIVGLCLHASHPDSLVVTRHNKPMMIGRAADGSMYLGSTSLAFPTPTAWLMRMPATSGAIVHRNGQVEVRPFQKVRIPMGKFPPATDIAERIMPLLRDRQPQPLGNLRDALRPLWPAGVLGEREIALYETLVPLVQDGRVELSNVILPGVDGKGQAPRTQARWTSV